MRKAPRSMAVSRGLRLQNSLTSHTSVAACGREENREQGEQGAVSIWCREVHSSAAEGRAGRHGGKSNCRRGGMWLAEPSWEAPAFRHTRVSGTCARPRPAAHTHLAAHAAVV